MSNKDRVRIKKGMVDIGQKKATKRVAIASATVQLSARAYKSLMAGESPKGDVFETAKIAGILAAKATPSIIPMCHPLPLNKVQISFLPDHSKKSICIKAEVVCLGRTGVEMEALTAASVSALTIYDMMKWAGQAMKIGEIRLNYKSGGRSGTYKSE